MTDDQAERIGDALNGISDKLAALCEETRETRFAFLDVLTGAPDGHHRLLWEGAHVLPARWANAAMDRLAAAPNDAAFEAAEAERIEAQNKSIAATVDHLERLTRARLADSLDEDEIEDCKHVLGAIAEARENARAA